MVKRLVNLIRFRNQHPSFEGYFTAQAPSPTELVLSWENDAECASLTIDLKAKTGHVAYTEDGQEKVFTIISMLSLLSMIDNRYMKVLPYLQENFFKIKYENACVNR